MTTFPTGIYLFKVNNGNKTFFWNLLKLDNKDTRTTLLTLFCCLYIEKISHIVLLFPFLILNKELAAGFSLWIYEFYLPEYEGLAQLMALFLVQNWFHHCFTHSLVVKLWDLFKIVVDKFKADERIMERHFRQEFIHFVDTWIVCKGWCNIAVWSLFWYGEKIVKQLLKLRIILFTISFA